MKVQKVSEVYDCESVSIVADGVDSGSRYHVALIYNKDTNKFVVSVSNFYVSAESNSISNCIYKLNEKGMAMIDVNSVHSIVTELLLPELKKKVGGLLG